MIDRGTVIQCSRCGRRLMRTRVDIPEGTRILASDLEPIEMQFSDGDSPDCKFCGSPFVKGGRIFTDDGWTL